MASVIQVENVSKQYRLGDIGTGALSHDLNRFWHRVRGKEDPYLKIGETNDRTSKGESEYVWSLQNVNFAIQKGDAVGIIGRNGAGKSTLLKILSRVTAPTTGSIKVKGRIASLLEVGTGFHPDLSGRENIYLNGAILGMRKQEIKRKFEEIVDFAGVERYIDTPVKRYSSGMYVRLAFAVAAHLESEILIVDEVLAVGDAEFQKKCLSKMGQVSKGEGRTVLFVSHTMSAVRQLCNRAILMSKGQVELEGSTSEIISHYLADKSDVALGRVSIEERENAEFFFTSVGVVNENGDEITALTNLDAFYIELTFTVTEEIKSVELSICFKNSDGINVFFTSLSDPVGGEVQDFKVGRYSAKARIRENFLMPGSYNIDIYAHHRNQSNIDTHTDIIRLSIVDIGSYMAPYGKAGSNFSCVLETCQWKLTENY